MTVEQFAKILAEETDKMSYGDIDVFGFKILAEGWPYSFEGAEEYDNAGEYNALKSLLENVLERVKNDI